MSITDGVGEGIRSVEVAVRCIGQCTIAIVGDRSAGSLCEGVDAKRVGVNVGVIRECGDNNRFVFIDVCRVIVGDGVVIDRCNCDVDGGSVRSTLSITDGVGEGIRSVEVTVRCIGQRAIAVVVDHSADALGEGINTDRIAVDIAVVRQYGDGDQDRIIFVHRCRVIIRGGVVIDRSNRDGGGACRRAPLAITDGIREAVAAMEVSSGCVGQRAVAIVGNGAVAALRDRIDAD